MAKLDLYPPQVLMLVCYFIAFLPVTPELFAFLDDQSGVPGPASTFICHAI